MPEDQLKLLYDAVSEDYDLGELDNFRNVMGIPGNRKLFFNEVSNTIDLGDDFDNFDRLIAPPSLIEKMDEKIHQIGEERELTFPEGYDYEEPPSLISPEPTTVEPSSLRTEIEQELPIEEPKGVPVLKPGFKRPEAKTAIRSPKGGRLAYEYPLTFMDEVERIKKKPGLLVGYLSSGDAIVELYPILSAGLKLQTGGKMEEKELILLRNFLEKSRQDRTFWNKVLSTTTYMLPFGQELLTTWGWYSVPQKAAMRGMKAGITKLFKEGGEELLEKKLVEIGLRSIALVAGGTTQLLPSGFLRIGTGTMGRMLPDYEVAEDEMGDLQALVIENGEDIRSAVIQAIGDQWIEVVTEHGGEVFSLLGKLGKNILIKNGILSAFLKANPGAKISDARKVIQKFGYNGVLNEMLEEEAGRIGRYVIGLEEYRAATLEDLAVEVVSFSVPALAGAIADKGKHTPEAITLAQIEGRRAYLRDILEIEQTVKRNQEQLIQQQMFEEEAPERREEQERVREEGKERKTGMLETLETEGEAVPELPVQQQIEMLQDMGYNEEEIVRLSGKERQNIINTGTYPDQFRHFTIPKGEEVEAKPEIEEVKEEIPEEKPVTAPLEDVEKDLLDRVIMINSRKPLDTQLVARSQEIAEENGYELVIEDNKAQLYKEGKLIREPQVKVAIEAEEPILLAEIPAETRTKIQEIINQLGADIDISDLTKEQIRGAIRDIKTDEGKEASIRAQKVINELLDAIESGTIPVRSQKGLKGPTERIGVPTEEVLGKEPTAEDADKWLKGITEDIEKLKKANVQLLGKLALTKTAKSRLKNGEISQGEYSDLVNRDIIYGLDSEVYKKALQVEAEIQKIREREIVPTEEVAEEKPEEIPTVAEKEIGQLTKEEFYKDLEMLYVDRVPKILPSGISSKKYAKEFIGTGKSHKNFVLELLEKGISVPAEVLKDYPDLVKEKPEEPEPLAKTPHDKIANYVRENLRLGTLFTWRNLFDIADEAYGGTQAQGKYSSKNAYDAMELGMNQYIAKSKGFPEISDIQTTSIETAQRIVKTLKEKLALLPTQTKRDKDTVEMQQFSTPPPLAYVVNWVANISNNDVVLEPSAGIAGIAVFAKNTGAEVYVNEIDEYRRNLLKSFFDEKHITKENAEYLNAVLPKHIKPTVVVMNPPFSRTVGMKGRKVIGAAAKHIEQALERLEEGGRLVAITGRGMSMNAPTFSDWWKRIMDKYNVRANMGIAGGEYTKYGTSFDNRILVIDKTGITPEKGNKIIQKDVKKTEELIPLLEGVRDERTPTIKQPSGEPEGEETPITGRRGGRTGSGATVRTPVNIPRGPRTGEEQRPPGTRPETGGLRPEPTQVEPGTTVEVPEVGAGIPEGQGGIGKPTGQEGGGRGVRPPVQQPPTETDRGTPGGLTTITTTKKLTPEEQEDITVFEDYEASVTSEGAKPHPAQLVESTAMAAVKAPKVTYVPKIDKSIIEKGYLSDAQMEAIIYAGASFQKLLANGERQGFFIGDGTGVGKGREIAGVMMDHWNRGYKKAVWVTKNFKLFKDAKRDLEGAGWKNAPLFSHNSVATNKKISQKDGILFTGYATLTRKGKKEGEQSRIDQLVEWLGEDFDGIIAFDESHHMGNAIPMSEGRGSAKPSQQGMMGVALQNALPKARIVYVSATGATEVRNLSYASRLGLWGEGTPYSGVRQFIDAISSGGLAAMEVVARDLKAMGLYTSRSISFKGVKYDTLKHDLSKEQRALYDELANIWQEIMRGSEKNLKKLKAPGEKVKNTRSQLYGSIQRFFSHTLTSMTMPTVMKQMRKDLYEGHSVVLQLVNTNEAGTKRALTRMESEDEILEELDVSPRDILRNYLEEFYPTELYQDVIIDGQKHRVPVLDSNDDPVEDPEAVAEKERLLSKIKGLPVPESALELLFGKFGTKDIAEVTGRSVRTYRDPDTGEMKQENRTPSMVAKEVQEFLDDRRQILIFSEAGGTGMSYHADVLFKNQRLRKHYVLQPGWRALVAIQGLGRTHRSNQKQPPEYFLVTTDVPAHMRFIATVSKRLDQMGALTRGQRQAGSQGLFSGMPNIESDYGTEAIRLLLKDLQSGTVEGLTIKDLEEYLGIKMTDNWGTIIQKQIPDVKKFLNRLLMTPLDVMTKMYDEFYTRFDRIVEHAIANGTYDAGVETVLAEEMKVLSETIIHTDKSGATTQYLVLELEKKHKILEYGAIKFEGYARNKNSGKLWGYLRERDSTSASTGAVTKVRTLYSTTFKSQSVPAEHFADKYEIVPIEDEKRLWSEEIAKSPKTYKETANMLAGALLPIWDKLPDKFRVNRIRTKKESLLGVVVHDRDLSDTLRRMGIDTTGELIKLPADPVALILEDNMMLRLINDWTIRKSMVSGDERIEIKGASYYDEDFFEKLDIFREDIGYKSRYFIPINDKANSVIKRIVDSYKLVRILPNTSRATGQAKEVGKPLYDKQHGINMPKEAETEELINKTDILKWTEEQFKIKIKGKATHRWRKNVRGKFYPDDVLIRIRTWGELAVMAHELGHHIDGVLEKAYGSRWKTKFIQNGYSVEKELKDFDYDKSKRRINEGFAEYIMNWLTDTGEAESKAPVFHGLFTGVIFEKRPQLATILEQLRHKMIVWQAQGAENRIIEHIDFEGEHTKEKGLLKKTEKIWGWIQKNWNDEFYYPQKVRTQIEKTIGRKLQPDEDPAKLMEVYKGKAGIIARTFVEKKAVDEQTNPIGKGLIEILKPIPHKDMKSFLAYGVARRSLHLQQRNIESGIDIDDAVYIVKKYDSKKWDKVLDEITEWNNHLLDWIVRAGGLGPREAAVMRELNPVYLPFKRAFIDELGVVKGAGGFVNRGQAVKAIKGSGRAIINPFEAMIAQATEMISKAHKIKIASLWAKLSREHGIGGFISKVPAPMGAKTITLKNISDLKNILEEMGFTDQSDLDMDKLLTVFFQEWQYRGKDNIVSIWNNGKREFYELHPELYQALSGMDIYRLPAIVDILFGKFARLLRMGATGLKISFNLMTNPARDAMSYAIFSKSNISMPTDIFRGAYKELAAKPGDLAWRFVRGGGSISGQIGLDRAATMASYDELLLSKLGKKGMALKVAKHPINTIREYISFWEMAPRIAEFENSYKRYKKEHPEWSEESIYIQSFLDAQDVTINFTKSGYHAKRVNAVAAFFNVAIRGPEKVYRAFRTQPIATTIKGIGWLTMVTIFLWYRNKDEDWYKNLPPAYKYNNWFIKITDKTIIRVPIPFDLGIMFASSVTAGLDYWETRNPKYLEGLWDLVKQQFPDPTPSTVGPALDVATNKNYLGIPIESEGMKYEHPTKRTRLYTSRMAKYISTWLDIINVNLSPIQIDYLIDSYTGGFRRQIPVELTKPFTLRKIKEPADIPVFGDVLLRMPENPRRQLNEFFGDWELLLQKEKSGIASKEELDKFRVIRPLYNSLTKDNFPNLKKYRKKEDMAKVRNEYELITKSLKRYGYK